MDEQIKRETNVEREAMKHTEEIKRRNDEMKRDLTSELKYFEGMKHGETAMKKTIDAERAIPMHSAEITSEQYVMQQGRARRERIDAEQREKAAGQAVGLYEWLLQRIKEFDGSLDQSSEVGVCLVSFGQLVTFHLRAVDYHNPVLIIFMGESVTGEPIELIQHISQISVLLTKMKRPDPSTPKQQFGFYDKKKEANPS